jgi:MFS family permease
MQRQRTAASLSFVLAASIVVAAILGPLVTGVIRFHLPDSLIVQYEGGEVVTLVVAVPLLIVAGILWRRGERLAPALAFGPATYTAYTFVTAIAGQEYGRYEGNSERAFFLYAGLIALGSAVAVLAVADLLRQPASIPPDRLRNVTAGIFLLIAAFFALAWIAQVVQVYRGVESTEYRQGPTLFWLIKMLDLGFLVPALGTIGIGLLRKSVLAARLSYGMVIYAVCMAGAILGMGIAMWIEDDPAASIGMIAFLAPVTAGLAIVAARMLVAYRVVPD